MEPYDVPPASARFSTPIDDTHTAQLRVMYSPGERQRRERRPEENGKSTEKTWGESQPAFGVGVTPYGEYLQPERAHPELGYTIPVNPGIEDHTVIDSMGGRVDRENENLNTVGDIGVVRIRRRLLDAIEAVQAGRDPQGVIRDPAQNGPIVISLPRS
jgi:hypothetical protein